MAGHIYALLRQIVSSSRQAIETLRINDTWMYGNFPADFQSAGHRFKPGKVY